jgi:Spy/CpxP family protein refolding chaperone
MPARQYRRGHIYGVVVLLFVGSAAWAQSNAAGAQATDPKSSAETIFAQLHTDIQALRTEARSQIRALLTEQQQTTFDTLDILNEPAAGKTCAGPAGALGDPNGTAPAGFENRRLDHLTQKLNLTDAQRASVQTIMENGQTARQKLEAQAHTDFRALLTPDQAALFDQNKGQAGMHGMGHRGKREQHGLMANQDALQLTADQQTQAQAIEQKLHADMQQLHQSTQQQIRAQLTADQQTLFDSLAKEDKPGKGMPLKSAGEARRGDDAPVASADAQPALHRQGHHPMGGRGGPHGDGVTVATLTAKLNLTDAQQAQIAPILDQLHASIETRIQQTQAAVQALVKPTAATPANTVPVSATP